MRKILAEISVFDDDSGLIIFENTRSMKLYNSVFISLTIYNSVLVKNSVKNKTTSLFSSYDPLKYKAS